MYRSESLTVVGDIYNILHFFRTENKETDFDSTNYERYQLPVTEDKHVIHNA